MNKSVTLFLPGGNATLKFDGATEVSASPESIEFMSRQGESRIDAGVPDCHRERDFQLKNDLDSQSHKFLALLMHHFELKEFYVSMEDIEAFKREYGGELPTVVMQATGGAVRVKLMSKSEVERLIQ